MKKKIWVLFLPCNVNLCVQGSIPCHLHVSMGAQHLGETTQRNADILTTATAVSDKVLCL